MAESELATYRSKRDFTKTAEPNDRSTVASSNRLRFVIQKHAADAPPLRSAAGTRRRVQVMGGDPRALARSA